MDGDLTVGIGSSEAEDPARAARNAVERALDAFEADGGTEPRFGIVFCSGGKYGRDGRIGPLVEAAEERLRSANPGIDWIGCTTAGEIVHGELRTGSCIALVMSAPGLDVAVGTARGAYDDGETAGQEAAAQLDRMVDDTETDDGLERFAVLLSPGPRWDSDGTEARVGDGVFQEIERVPIIGGAAGDDLELVNTYQFANGEVHDDMVVIAGIAADLTTGFAWGDGFQRTGKTATVTKASGPRIEELDGQPALERYAELLEVPPHELWNVKNKVMEKVYSLAGEYAEKLSVQDDPYANPFIAKANTFPFGISGPDDRLLVRGPKKVVGRSIVVTPPVPENSTVYLLEYDEEGFRRTERDVIDSLANRCANSKLLLLSESSTRFSGVGQEEMEEIFSDMATASSEHAVFGFSCMGEYVADDEGVRGATCHAVSAGCIGK